MTYKLKWRGITVAEGNIRGLADYLAIVFDIPARLIRVQDIIFNDYQLERIC